MSTLQAYYINDFCIIAKPQQKFNLCPTVTWLADEHENVLYTQKPVKSAP